jgi:hypothetical protein
MGELDDRFPDMTPLRRPPTLQTINGIGTSIVGWRDLDEETGTYVKTQVFTVLFLPLFALAAYRVADATNGGWYFIGRVPLSGVARGWNCLVVLLILSLSGYGLWDHYTSSPYYIAGRTLSAADSRAAAGEVGAAAQMYKQVILGGTGHASGAGRQLQALIDGPVETAAPDQAAEVFKVAVALQKRPHAPSNVVERGMQVADKRAPDDPKAALFILEAIAPLAPAPDVLAARQQALLERLIAQAPDDPEWASRLAVVFEADYPLPVPPPEHLTPRVVGWGVILAAVEFEPPRFAEFYRTFLGLGLDVLRGRSSWEKAAAARVPEPVLVEA